MILTIIGKEEKTIGILEIDYIVKNKMVLWGGCDSKKFKVEIQEKTIVFDDTQKGFDDFKCEFETLIITKNGKQLWEIPEVDVKAYLT